MTKDKAWQTISSTYIVNDRWLKLRADACLTPERKTIAPYYVLEYPDFTTCIVIDEDLQIILIRQYRHAANEFVLEIPAGWMDPNDSSPKTAVQREIAEELGYVGGEVFAVGSMYSNPANITNKVHAFIAVGGRVSQEPQLGEGETSLTVEKMPIKEFWRYAGTSGNGNEVLQSLHLASVFLAQQFILSSDSPRFADIKAALMTQ